MRRAVVLPTAGMPVSPAVVQFDSGVDTRPAESDIIVGLSKEVLSQHRSEILSMLSFLHHARIGVAFATFAAFAAIPAHATVFSIQGTFGNTNFTGPLNGGSF